MPVLFSIILLQIFSLKSIGMNLNLFQINNSSCTEGISRKGSRFNTLNLCTIYTERWWFSLCDCPRLLNSNALNELERYTLKITKTIVIVIICPWRQKRLKSSYSFFFFFPLWALFSAQLNKIKWILPARLSEPVLSGGRREMPLVIGTFFILFILINSDTNRVLETCLSTTILLWGR